jgi:hypothetical protein
MSATIAGPGRSYWMMFRTDYYRLSCWYGTGTDLGSEPAIPSLVGGCYTSK